MALNRFEKIDLLQKAGYSGKFTGIGVDGEIGQMKECRDRCSKFNALAEEASKGLSTENEKKLILAFAEKWKSDPAIYDKIEKDLTQNPAAADKIKLMVQKDPGGFIKSFKNYTGGNMDAVLIAADKTAATTPTTAKHAPAAAPSTAPSGAPVVVLAQNAPATPAATKEDEKIDPIQFMADLAAASDDDIKHMDKDAVKGILLGLADNAKESGVNGSTVDGFKSRIEKNEDQLVEKITENWQNNPEFVREFAKTSLKSLKEPKKPGEKAAPAVITAMTDIMENPEHLAEDKYVKSLASDMKMADSALGTFMSGISKGLGDFFSGMSGKLGQAFKQIMGWFSDMFGGNGGKSAISMQTGKGFLPEIMINMGLMRDNGARRMIEDSYGPKDVKAYPIVDKDGKYFHDEKYQEKDPKTGELIDKTRPVPNTIEVKDVDGKSHKWIPSDGLKAAQMPDGNYRVTAATKLSQDGITSGIETVTMTPAAFETYKKEVEKVSGRTYGVNENAPISIQVTKIDPKNGALMGAGTVTSAPETGADVQIWGYNDPNAPKGKNMQWEPDEPRPSGV